MTDNLEQKIAAAEAILTVLKQADVVEIDGSPLLTGFDYAADESGDHKFTDPNDSAIVFSYEQDMERYEFDFSVEQLSQAQVNSEGALTLPFDGESITIRIFSLEPVDLSHLLKADPLANTNVSPAPSL